MSFDLQKVKDFSNWVPSDRDIKWTRDFIYKNFKSSRNEEFIWASSFYSIKFTKDNKAIFQDINLIEKDFMENLSRTTKILEELHYEVIFPENIIVNASLRKRLFPDGRVISNISIPKGQYSN